jgi:hypothetical protein
MLRPVLIALIFIAAPPIVSAQQRPSSLLQKRVTFTLATHWEIQHLEDSATDATIQILIPYPETEKIPRSVNVTIVTNIAPAGVTIKEVGDKVYGYPGVTVVNDIPDGKEWRTIVWTDHTGDPFVMLNRIGCANGIAVEVLMAFPFLKNGDPKWLEKAISEFNSLCETLKIDAKNSTEAKVSLGELTDLPKPKLPAYLRPEHKSVLEKWLKEKHYLRPATESDCADKEYLEILRKAWGKDFNPYYSIGDFNRDGKYDFAVLLVDLKNGEQGGFAIAIFNAPFVNKKAPNYFEEGYDSLGHCYIVYNKTIRRRLFLGMYESDVYSEIFYPKGARRYYRYCLSPDEADRAQWRLHTQPVFQSVEE